MKAEGRFTEKQLLDLSKALWAARGAVDAAKTKEDRSGALSRLTVASDKIRLARACNEALDAEPAPPPGKLRARKRIPEGRFVDEPKLEVPQNSSPAGESLLPTPTPHSDSPGRADPSTKKARKS